MGWIVALLLAAVLVLIVSYVARYCIFGVQLTLRAARMVSDSMADTTLARGTNVLQHHE